MQSANRNRCTALHCDEPVSPARVSLGYSVCLQCGELQAKRQRSSWTVAPMNKSNYILVTDRDLLKQLNPKRTT